MNMYEACLSHASSDPGIVGFQIVAPEFQVDPAPQTPLLFSGLKGEWSVFF